MARHTLRAAVLGYLAALLLVPVAMVGYRTFEHGAAPVWHALTTPATLHATGLSLLVAAISVPANIVFGVGTALLISRRHPRLRAPVNLLTDLPFAMSPVVIGLALYLLYGHGGWLGSMHLLFALPGIALATTLVTLPFVVREVLPVLDELGIDPEHAAETLGAGPWRVFRSITLPAIRWALVYGVVLSTARALGEYGAVSIVSGNVVGQTQTLPLVVEQDFHDFDTVGAYSAGFLLGVISLLVLAALSLLRRRRSA